MSLIPIATAFVIALVGAAAVGLRPGYSFVTLLMGATLVGATTGIVASALEFLARRRYTPAAIVVGCVAGLVVGALLRIAEPLGLGDARGPVLVVWPIAIVSSLLLSRHWGMRLPPLRRRPGIGRS